MLAIQRKMSAIFSATFFARLRSDIYAADVYVHLEHFTFIITITTVFQLTSTVSWLLVTVDVIVKRELLWGYYCRLMVRLNS